MKKITSILLGITLLAATVVRSEVVKLSWDTYINTDGTVSMTKIYAIKGTNAVFAAGNSNATLIGSTSIANSTFSVSNLTSGAWTFTATAYSTNGIESLNSNTVWTNVRPDSVISFRVGQ